MSSLKASEHHAAQQYALLDFRIQSKLYDSEEQKRQLLETQNIFQDWFCEAMGDDILSELLCVSNQSPPANHNT